MRILRFENEAEDLLRYLKASGIEPGLEGTLVAHDDEQVVVRTAAGRIASSRRVSLRRSPLLPTLPRRRAPPCPSSWSSASAMADS